MLWAWRSFLSRSQPLLLSSLRPARRHGSQLTTVLGRNKPIGTRGYSSKSIGDPPAKAKQHLYVVLDNYEDGYGVHRLDLGDHSDHLEGGARCLPEPPVLRVALTTLRDRVQFAAVGSCIVAIGTTIETPMLSYRWLPGPIGGVLIYNINTAELIVTPHLPSDPATGGYKAAMAIGNTLYMLGSERPVFDDEEKDNCGGSLHFLTADTDDLDWSDDDVFDMRYWKWLTMSSTCSWLWSSFYCPPSLPFKAEHITAHVAHQSPRRPAARPKMLVSLRPTEASPLGATFSFSTTNRRWRRCGKWHMPAVGQVHYDSELDAWIGLHAISDRNIDGPLVTDGRLCFGNNISARSEWKVGKEKLFRLDEDSATGWRHIDAKFVPIASSQGHNEYCLMERLRPEVEEEDGNDEEAKSEEQEEMKTAPDDEEYWGDGGRCLLRLTCFRVERDTDGEPMATACGLPLTYEVSWHNRHFDAQAFWM